MSMAGPQAESRSSQEWVRGERLVSAVLCGLAGNGEQIGDGEAVQGGRGGYRDIKVNVLFVSDQVTLVIADARQSTGEVVHRCVRG